MDKNNISMSVENFTDILSTDVVPKLISESIIFWRILFKILQNQQFYI